MPHTLVRAGLGELFSEEGWGASSPPLSLPGGRGAVPEGRTAATPWRIISLQAAQCGSSAPQTHPVALPLRPR